MTQLASRPMAATMVGGQCACAAALRGTRISQQNRLRNTKYKVSFRPAARSQLARRLRRLHRHRHAPPPPPPPFAADTPHAQNSGSGTFDSVTVLFARIEGFTAWSASVTPDVAFYYLGIVFREFDFLAHKLGIYKLEASPCACDTTRSRLHFDPPHFFIRLPDRSGLLCAPTPARCVCALAAAHVRHAPADMAVCGLPEPARHATQPAARSPPRRLLDVSWPTAAPLTPTPRTNTHAPLAATTR